jgi:hypothetical protein
MGKCKARGLAALGSTPVSGVGFRISLKQS